MQSRMDKYNANSTRLKTRTEKNHELYENVRNSALTEFDVNSNVSVIDNEADIIDVKKVQKMLDKRYNETTSKRRSIEIPEYEDPVVIDDPIVDTKEYDINAIIAKAKQGKNVDYTKERLKKVREAQYEILNNLDLELKKVEETKTDSRKQEEAHLMDLINTITELEMKNKNVYDTEVNDALDLLSDLKGDDSETDEEITREEITQPQEQVETEEKNIREPFHEKTEDYQEVKLIVEDQDEENEQTTVIETEDDESDEDKTVDRDEYIEETLSKLNIDMTSYDEFSDIAKNDTGALILKIIIFVIIISLVVGGVYIIDNLLGLGLF